MIPQKNQRARRATFRLSPRPPRTKKGYWDRAHVLSRRSAGPRARLTMQRGGAGRGVGRFNASHWRTRPFLSPRSPAPPPSTARLPGAPGVDGSRRMLIRGRPPQPIGRPRSVGEVSAESQKNRAGPTAACSASGAGRAPPARQPGDPQGKPAPAAPRPTLARSPAPALGACASPAPAGGAFVSRSEEVRLKGQLLEGLGGPPPPRASPVVAGETVAPLGRTLLPACLVDPQFLRESFPVCRGLGYSRFFFFWWVGVRAIMASARRTSACFRLAAIWVGGGDIKARVGLRCKVKLPRRGSSAAARGRRRERAAGWRLLRCVHSLASLWRRGRREQSKDCRPGLGPARMSGYVCMCVRGRRCLLIRPCFFILHPSE